MANGYIYILVNDAMPSFVKVGKTAISASERALSLSSATGVPSAFKVFKSYAVQDCDAAEATAHRILERAVGRPNPNREFFNGPVDIIARILDDALAALLTKGNDENPGLFADALLNVTRKEFTLACFEFESAFASRKLQPQEIYDKNMQRLFGAYIACCCASNRDPINQQWLRNVTIKADILTEAKEFMSTWDSDPIERLLPFFRRYN